MPRWKSDTLLRLRRQRLRQPPPDAPWLPPGLRGPGSSYVVAQCSSRPLSSPVLSLSSLCVFAVAADVRPLCYCFCGLLSRFRRNLAMCVGVVIVWWDTNLFSARLQQRRESSFCARENVLPVERYCCALPQMVCHLWFLRSALREEVGGVFLPSIFELARETN